MWQRILEARNCPLTDGGIRRLCSNIDAIKSIETFNILGTKVSKNGMRMALESMPSLKDFCCNFPTQLLAKLSGTPLERLCSSASKIWLSSSRINNNALLELLKLKELCQLQIHSRGDLGQLSFNEGILPILKKFGSSLTSLTISNLHQCPINIWAIVKNCQKLETLALVDIETISIEKSEDEQNPSKGMKIDPVLENLKRLHLKNCRHLTSEDLDLLLASPALEELTLEEIDSANDVAFQKAENVHQFRNLNSLMLICRNATKVVIDMLMNDANPLKICRCHSCSSEDIRNWKSTAREKSWDCIFASCSHTGV